MRNPALRLVGIGASPQGGGVFGTRAEEELRLWLESRLDALGIDPVAYSRFVLSLLRRPDSALSPPHGEGVDTSRTAGGGGRRHRVKTRPRIQGDRDQRHAVVQCLTNAADQKCGVESLVDELCTKLRDLEGGGSNEDKEECRKIDGEEKNTVVETLTPRDRALRYYAAFPALQPATPKKTIHKKDKNTAGVTINHKSRIIGINSNNIRNSNKNNNNSHIRSGGNIRGRHRKSKMPITIDAQRSANKESFGFAKSMEREREKERELELDQLRLAQLQAKFDESLEALWDTGPSNAQDKASIWAAPSLSIPSGPLWPIDTSEMPLILPMHDIDSTTTTPYQDDSIVDDSPIIPWDIDSIRKYTDDTSGKDKIDYNLNWSDYIGDGPWNWKDLGNNLMNMTKSPKATGCFIPVTPRKSPIINSNNNSNNNDDKTNDNTNISDNNNTKESSPQQKVNSLDEVDEDLLTSARTHFRPIKDDGHWADGTTFPVNNNIERVTYRRSESGNLLYLPDDESPYMEYRESTTPLPIASANLTLKFRVRQCDKSIQTDPIRSPVKRRIIAEADHFYYSSVDADDILTHESDDVEKDSYTLGQLRWMQPSVSLLNDRKRRHSSSFHCRPLAALRPLTL